MSFHPVAGISAGEVASRPRSLPSAARPAGEASRRASDCGGISSAGVGLAFSSVGTRRSIRQAAAMSPKAAAILQPSRPVPRRGADALSSMIPPNSSIAVNHKRFLVDSPRTRRPASGPLAALPFGLFIGGLVDQLHDGTMNLEPAPELMVTNHLNEVLPRHRRDELMALVNVRPTKPDELIARTVARNTNHSAEVISRGLTWGADEKILLLLATAGWVATRGRSQQLQRAGNHALLVAVTASLIPHGMKSIFDQTRPDRK